MNNTEAHTTELKYTKEIKIKDLIYERGKMNKAYKIILKMFNVFTYEKKHISISHSFQSK